MNQGKNPSLSLSKMTAKGQTVVEYILILVVVVGIIVGLFYQFNKGVKGFMQAYFGEDGYLECLLQTGELPPLSGAGGNGECKFPAFDFKANAPNSNGYQANGGKNASNTTGDKSKYNKSEGKSASRGTDGRGRGSSGGPGGSIGGNRIAANPPLKGNKKGDLTESPTYTGSTKVSSRFVRYGGNSSAGTRVPALIGKFSYTDDADNKKKKVVPAESISKNNSGTMAKRRILATIKKSENIANSSDSNWSLGELLKYLLMAAIAIAIIVFLGGQIMSVSKGWEK